MEELKLGKVNQFLPDRLPSRWQRQNLQQGGLFSESTFFPLHTRPLSKQLTSQELPIKYHTSYGRTKSARGEAGGWRGRDLYQDTSGVGEILPPSSQPEGWLSV